MNFDKLATFGSAKLNYFSDGSKTTLSHWISAETVGEKTHYLPAGQPTAVNAAVWNPFFLIGIKGPAQLGGDQEYAVTFAMEWTFDLTFRGTR